MNQHEILIERLLRRVENVMADSDLRTLAKVAEVLFGADDPDVIALWRALGGKEEE